MVGSNKWKKNSSSVMDSPFKKDSDFDRTNSVFVDHTKL